MQTRRPFGSTSSEMEALPTELSNTLVLQAMFSVALAAKIVYVKDVGRGAAALQHLHAEGNSARDARRRTMI